MEQSIPPKRKATVPIVLFLLFLTVEMVFAHTRQEDGEPKVSLGIVSFFTINTNPEHLAMHDFVSGSVMIREKHA